MSVSLESLTFPQQYYFTMTILMFILLFSNILLAYYVLQQKQWLLTTVNIVFILVYVTMLVLNVLAFDRSI